MRAGLVVAVRAPPQVLCVASAKLCREVFVRFGPEAGRARVVYGSGDGELHPKVQGLGRAVAALGFVAAAARRAPGVLVRAVRMICATAFCCFVIILAYSSGRRKRASNGAVVAPGPLASEDAVVGLRDTYGVCGIRVRAEAMRKWCYGQEC